MKYFIGIDPGVDGGLAIINERDLLFIAPMPTVEIIRAKKKRKMVNAKMLDSMIRGWVPDDIFYRDVLVALEEFSVMPGKNKRGNSVKTGAVSAATIGRNFGRIETVLELRQMPFIIVKAQLWYKEILSGQSAAGGKKPSVEYVTKRFPDANFFRTPRCTVPHNGMTDAVCLALYGKAITL